MIFSVGDIIDIDHCCYKYKGKGEIQAIRHAVGNHRTGELSLGCDILISTGRVMFVYMHDLAGMNPDKLKVLT